jgi:thiol-disulfide isomerase/thioredoxin
MPVEDPTTLDARLDDSLRARRFQLALLVTFAVAALVLAACGGVDATDARSPVPARNATTAPLLPTDAQALPEFDLATYERLLEQLGGTPVLVNFWGSWCGPCRREVPFMKAAYAQFRSRGLEVIGMDYEQGATEQQVRAYLQDQGVTWTFATPDSVKDVIMDRFQISSFPTLWLLDREGRLLETRSAMLRGDQLARTLDFVLPE